MLPRHDPEPPRRRAPIAVVTAVLVVLGGGTAVMATAHASEPAAAGLGRSTGQTLPTVSPSSAPVTGTAHPEGRKTGRLSVTGTPKVGRTLHARVTGLFVPRGEKERTAVRWLLGTRHVGTGPSIKVKASWKGKRLHAVAVETWKVSGRKATTRTLVSKRVRIG